MTDISDQIIQRICECGWSAYLCGGAVRDMFIDLDPNDYDIVTDATPDDLFRIFPDRKVNMVGANFLVTLIDNIEVSTYRSDRNFGSGRHNCVTEACETLEEDLLRRDFTFNAMAVCPYTGEVVDYYNGRADLENKVVKFVGNPVYRIDEDYLRMLRAARFTCLIEGKLDNEAFEAIKANKHLIKKVSPERIQLELMKVMKYERPSIFFDVLHETGLLKLILPEFEELYGHTGGQYHAETLDVHCKLTGDYLSPKDPLLRLVGYLHDIGKPLAYRLNAGKDFVDHEKFGCVIVEDILDEYKFSNAAVDRATSLVLYHMRSIKDLGPKGYRRLVKKLSDNNVNWKDWFKLKMADKKANLKSDDFGKENIKEVCLNIFKAKHESKSGGFKITDLDINGNDIMEILHIKPGPFVGQILNELLELVLESPELNNFETLRQIVRLDHGIIGR